MNWFQHRWFRLQCWWHRTMGFLSDWWAVRTGNARIMTVKDGPMVVTEDGLYLISYALWTNNDPEPTYRYYMQTRSLEAGDEIRWRVSAQQIEVYTNNEVDYGE